MEMDSKRLPEVKQQTQSIEGTVESLEGSIEELTTKLECVLQRKDLPMEKKGEGTSMTGCPLGGQLAQIDVRISVIHRQVCNLLENLEV